MCGLVIKLTISRYLNVRFGMVWTDLKDLQVPLRVGDVVILPGKSIPPNHPRPCQSESGIEDESADKQ